VREISYVSYQPAVQPVRKGSGIMLIKPMTLEEIRESFTEEMCIKELEEAKKLPFLYDPDCPPCSKEKLEKFKRVSPKKTAV